MKYNDWFVEHVPFQYAAQAVVHEWLDELQRVSTPTEGGELHRRSDRREAHAEIVERVVGGSEVCGWTSNIGTPDAALDAPRRAAGELTGPETAGPGVSFLTRHI